MQTCTKPSHFSAFIILKSWAGPGDEATLYDLAKQTNVSSITKSPIYIYIYIYIYTYPLALGVSSHVRHPSRYRQTGVGQLDEVLLDVGSHLLCRPSAHCFSYLLVPLSLHSLRRVDLQQLLKLGLATAREC